MICILRDSECVLYHYRLYHWKNDLLCKFFLFFAEFLIKFTSLNVKLKHRLMKSSLITEYTIKNLDIYDMNYFLLKISGNWYKTIKYWNDVWEHAKIYGAKWMSVRVCCLFCSMNHKILSSWLPWKFQSKRPSSSLGRFRETEHLGECLSANIWMSCIASWS